MGQIAGDLNIITLARTLKPQFFSALDKVDMSMFNKLVTEIPSNSKSESYGWLGNSPAISEFKDERKIRGLYESGYSLINKKWEGTLRVGVDELEDDQLGQIKVRINDLAVRAANHPSKLLMNDVIIDGATEQCYDSQFFYDTDHADTGGASYTTSQSNKLTGTGTSLTQLETDFTAARAAMRVFKDGQGEIFHEAPLKLIMMVPPALENIAEKLMNASEISNTTNVLKNAAEIMVNPYASDANDWYLFNVGSFLKPFIYQKRVAMQFNAQEKESEAGFMRDAFHYGTRARYNLGYGLWQNAILTTNA